MQQVEGDVADGGPYPERLHLIALASDFNGRFLELCHDWIEEVRAEVQQWPTTVALGPTERTRRPLVAILRRARSIPWRTGGGGLVVLVSDLGTQNKEPGVRARTAT